MQFIPMNRVHFVPQVEPVDMDLAPYLTSLDVDDAVQSFGQLADRLLSQEGDQSFLGDLCANNSEQLPLPQHHWPLATPSTSTSPSSSLSSSQASSPAPSDLHYACLNLPASHSSTSFSSFGSSYSFSSSGSSGPASVASSCDLRDDRSANGGGHHNRAGHPGSRSRKRNNQTSELRQKNASAAEKYRRRLKGREWSLQKEMEREQARNARLRRSLEAKLTLYREYVALLASNTCDQDAELATVGLRTLSAIMGEVLGGGHQQRPSASSFPVPGAGSSRQPHNRHGHLSGDDDDDNDYNRREHEVDDETELRNQLNRFQQIIATSTTRLVHP